MKKSEKLEMKIYELLGVKAFRKMAFFVRDTLAIPFNLDIPKEKRKEKLYSRFSNYNLGKVRSVEDLKKYKKMIFINTFIHIWGLLVCLPGFFRTINGITSMSFGIINLGCIILNSYCIMLQRYNCIRINQLIEKMKIRDEKQKEKIREELRKEDSMLLDHTYKIVDSKEKDNEFDVTIEDLIQNANLEQLKKYRDYLSQFQMVNQEIQNDKVLSNFDEVEVKVPTENGKQLKLKLRKSKNDKCTNT